MNVFALELLHRISIEINFDNIFLQQAKEDFNGYKPKKNSILM